MKRYGLCLFFGLLMTLTLISLFSCSSYSSPTTSAAPSTGTGNSVTLSNFAFSPATLTVKTGTTVTWTNKDAATHTITSDTGAFDSGNLAANASYSFSFTKSGTYSYHCSIHTYMKGTIIVQ